MSKVTRWTATYRSEPMQEYNSFMDALRAHGRGENGDFTLALEAAAEIDRLRAEVDEAWVEGFVEGWEASGHRAFSSNAPWCDISAEAEARRRLEERKK